MSAAKAGKTGLTKAQRELARHALGLTNGRTISYRNRFVTGGGCADHQEWMQMVRNGFAGRRAGVAMFGGDDLFWLTLVGAQAALHPGETLDPEDFPGVPPSGGEKQHG